MSTLVATVLDGRLDARAPCVAEDGSTAFLVSKVDLGRNRTTASVWLWDRDAGSPRQLLGETELSTLAWTRDAQLLVTSRARDRHLLWCLDPREPGHRRLVAATRELIREAQVDPAGMTVAFLSRCRHSNYELPISDQPPRRIRKLYSQRDGVGWLLDRPQHIHIADLNGDRIARCVSHGLGECEGLAWLPDGSGWLTIAARHREWDIDRLTDLLEIRRDGQMTARTDTSQGLMSFALSPCGTTAAVVGHDEPVSFPQNARVGVIDLSGAKPSPAMWISDQTLNFAPSQEGSPLRWIARDAVVAKAETRGAVHIFRVETDLADRRTTALTDGSIAVTEFDAQSGFISYTASTARHPAELVTPSGRGTRLSRPRTKWRRFRVSCDEQQFIDAWILLPARSVGVDASYPLLVNVHGGPFAQAGESYFEDAYLQAAAGFAVVVCNPRGSSGRGEGWAQAIAGRDHSRFSGDGWGSHDVTDVLTVVEATLTRFPVCDPNRVGLIGGSYGGYLAVTLASRTDRFGAVCVERGSCDLASLDGTSDNAGAYRGTMGSTPLENPALYAEQSPLRRVADIVAPVLIIHADDDLRNPIGQASQLFTALRLANKDVTLYRFPGEGHAMARIGSPRHRAQRAAIILDFFLRHLAAAPVQERVI